MNWGDLPFLLAVADHGTLVRAGEVLGTNATTVARRIHRLEQAVGARLFEQTQQGQTPTIEGERLLARAREMAKIAAQADHVAADDAITGSVRLSVAEGFGVHFVAPRLGGFASLHPGLAVDLVANSGFLNPTRRETDLAVLLARPRRGPLVTRKLTDYSLGLFAARHRLEEAGDCQSLDDLAAHALVGYVPDIIYAPELRYLEELSLSADVRLRSSSINAQYRIIAAGAGIGILPHFIGCADSDLIPVLPDIRIERSFWLVAHRETARFAQVRAMMDWLVHEVKTARQLFLPD